MRTPAPTNPLSMKLRDLGDAWLSLKCTSRTTQIPMKAMAEHHGTDRRLGEILPKLRCRQCGRAPESIEFTDDPTRDAPGKARNTEAWAIDLSRYAGPRDAVRICKQVDRYTARSRPRGCECAAGGGEIGDGYSGIGSGWRAKMKLRVSPKPEILTQSAEPPSPSGSSNPTSLSIRRYGW
jgi:hypothetical protein